MSLPEDQCFDYLVFQFEGLLGDVEFLLGEGHLFQWWQSVMEAEPQLEQWKPYFVGDYNGRIRGRKLKSVESTHFTQTREDLEAWSIVVGPDPTSFLSVAISTARFGREKWMITGSVARTPATEQPFVELCEAVAAAINNDDVQCLGFAGHSYLAGHGPFSSAFFLLGKVFGKDAVLETRVAGMHWMNLTPVDLLSETQLAELGALGAAIIEIEKVVVVRLCDRPSELTAGVVDGAMAVVKPLLPRMHRTLPDDWWLRGERQPWL